MFKIIIFIYVDGVKVMLEVVMYYSCNDIFQSVFHKLEYLLCFSSVTVTSTSQWHMIKTRILRHMFSLQFARNELQIPIFVFRERSMHFLFRHDSK